MAQLVLLLLFSFHGSLTFIVVGFYFLKVVLKSQKNKITENRLEGTSGGHLAQSPALNLNRVFQDLVHVLSTSKDGDSTISLGLNWKWVIPTQEISHNRKKSSFLDISKRKKCRKLTLTLLPQSSLILRIWAIAQIRTFNHTLLFSYPSKKVMGLVHYTR